MSDAERLLSIIGAAPLPSDKTDSELAQEYRNWYYGIRAERLKLVEPTAMQPWWECPECHSINYPIRNVCQNRDCGMPQPK